jgi:hypothetical protein
VDEVWADGVDGSLDPAACSASAASPPTPALLPLACAFYDVGSGGLSSAV